MTVLADVLRALELEFPSEHAATCDDCVMLPPADEPVGASHFRPATKCCTYVPTLANYLVGGILRRDPSGAEHGPRTVRARIVAGDGVTPLGVRAPTLHRLLYARGQAGFGRATSLRCPHYVEGPGHNCSIWAQRSAICATWYCRHDRGARGAELWAAIRDLLRCAEQALARWCVLEMGLAPEQLASLLALSEAPDPNAPEGLDDQALDGKGDEELLRRVWGPWRGREEAFYIGCAERFEQLDPASLRATLLRIGGVELELHLRAVAHAHARLDASLPETLRAGRVVITSAGDGRVHLTSYSPRDPLLLPTAVLAVLDAFDGRPTAEVREGLAAQGLDVDDAFLGALADFDVLVASR